MSRREREAAQILYGGDTAFASSQAVSILTDILDRLSNVAALRERVADLADQLVDIRKVVIEQQKDVAELKGQLKALIQIQAQRSK